MNTIGTEMYEKDPAAALSPSREESATAMPQDVLNEIDSFFNNPEEYSVETPVIESALAMEGLPPQQFNNSKPPEVTLDDLDLVVAEIDKKEMSSPSPAPIPETTTLEASVLPVSEQRDLSDDVAQGKTAADTARDVPKKVSSVDIESPHVEPEESAHVDMPEEANVADSIGQTVSPKTPEKAVQSEELANALAQALPLAEIEKFPYDGEYASHLEGSVPSYVEAERQRILQKKVALFLDAHGGDVVLPETYEQLRIEAETLKDEGGTRRFDESLTPSGRKRLAKVIEAKDGGLDLNKLSPENAEQTLSELDTPAELLSGFFELYTNDQAGWNSAQVIPEQRRVVDRWVEKLAESLGGDKNDLHDMQEARLHLIEYGHANGIDLAHSLGLRHINWLYEEMRAKFPEFSQSKNAAVELTHTYIEKEPSVTEKISADLAGRQWGELAPSEQLHLWKGWSPAERQSARTHPDVSGYSPDVSHPDVTEIPGKTGYPNFDILGNGGEGVTGITPNFEYVAALAKGKSHDEAFKEVYGRDRAEWLESVHKESIAAGKNPELIDTQLSIFEKQSAKMAVADQDFYVWEPPQEVQFRQDADPDTAAEKLPEIPVEIPAEATMSKKEPLPKNESEDWNDYFAGESQAIEDPTSSEKAATVVQTPPTAESNFDFTEAQAGQAEGVWKMYLKSIQRAEATEGEAGMKMRDAALSRAETQIKSFFLTPQENGFAPSTSDVDVDAHMLAHLPNDAVNVLKNTQLYRRLSENS